ncbi:MAG: HNH endonuclease signature motif containing protein [Candidatus Thiodiazotropha taylori]|nr:HNH endonuclease [Candidatus Thiodiazotropha taylori]MCG7908983.1 HNH endonuclease [Candidatus Thiodiazotropha taylori]MCG7957853.1 HNH endonuclease [Candidatus Thiodiazotropha taylori]MCG8073004.1 HNH endonuclease [Candidatus Thiodiazotropha taylori]MCG8087195.1 HNH endonuclease [Candidatus Thiodiazotropha taylori]
MDRSEFPIITKKQALSRQRNRCASCGTEIASLNQIGKRIHQYGEGAHAHHIKPCQHGGTNHLSNCVILCESCHYSAHEGGHYRNNSDYLVGKPSDYEHFHG